MCHKGPQKIIFSWRELHFVASHRHDPAYQIDAQISRAEDWMFTPLLQTMALCCAHASQKFVNSERFGDVVVCAKIEGLDFTLFIAAARKNNDRQRRAAAANAADDFQSVQIWKPQVQDEQVRRALTEGLECGNSVACFVNKIALACEGRAQ